jgi:hypothetical protein
MKLEIRVKNMMSGKRVFSLPPLPDDGGGAD